VGDGTLSVGVSLHPIQLPISIFFFLPRVTVPRERVVISNRSRARPLLTFVAVSETFDDVRLQVCTEQSPRLEMTDGGW
jgi:hypothetical protein